MPNKIRTWSPDFTKVSPYEGMTGEYAEKVKRGFKPRAGFGTPFVRFYEKTPTLRAQGRAIAKKAGIEVPFSFLEHPPHKRLYPPRGSASTAPVTTTKAPKIPSGVTTVRGMSTKKQR